MKLALDASASWRVEYLRAERDRLRAALEDLLDEMAEDTGQRHHRDKYRVYQITPSVVEDAREALGPAEGTAPNAVETICEACSERFITNLPGWCLKCKATADKLRRILVAREALGPAQEVKP